MKAGDQSLAPSFAHLLSVQTVPLRALHCDLTEAGVLTAALLSLVMRSCSHEVVLEHVG